MLSIYQLDRGFESALHDSTSLYQTRGAVAEAIKCKIKNFLTCRMHSSNKSTLVVILDMYTWKAVKISHNHTKLDKNSDSLLKFDKWSHGIG